MPKRHPLQRGKTTHLYFSDVHVGCFIPLLDAVFIDAAEADTAGVEDAVACEDEDEDDNDEDEDEKI